MIYLLSACGLFTKHRERIKKFKETGNLNYIYKNKLDEACLLLQHMLIVF